MQATSIQDKARAASEWFELATRDDDSSYVRTKDGAPEWVTEIVYDAHGDLLPDDWRYEVIRDAFEFIAEADDPDDGEGEFADSAVDVYTGARFAWLSSHLSRQGYVDEAADEFGSREAGHSIADEIGLGQYMEAREVYGLVMQGLAVYAGPDDD